MTVAEAPPLSYKIDVATIRPDGLTVTIDTDDAVRDAVAKSLDIPAVKALAAEFSVTRKGARVKVRGDVKGIVTRLCVLSLEPFDVPFHERVEVDFDEAPSDAPAPADDDQRPDPIIDGAIDLGVLATEFTALSLDPYPKKPGVVFDYREDDDEPPSPFSALAKIKASS